MRVVLRQPKTGMYLQNSGEWVPERASARVFESAVVAYWWAAERSLAAEVWLSLNDPSKDFACMHLQPRLRHPVIDCQHDDWNMALRSFLHNEIEVDLIHFDYRKHRESCELIVQSFAMELMLDPDPQSKAAHCRRAIRLGQPM